MWIVWISNLTRVRCRAWHEGLMLCPKLYLDKAALVQCYILWRCVGNEDVA
jgi:hypothetical protein